MPECAVPTTALLNTSRPCRNGVLTLLSVGEKNSPSVLLCEPLSVFFFSTTKSGTNEELPNMHNTQLDEDLESTQVCGTMYATN